MLDGALDWQNNGLLRPKVVKAATAEYFADQDTVKQWIEDCCDVSKQPPHLQDTFSSLFGSWHNYAAARGEAAGTAKGFSEKLKRLGYLQIKDTAGIRGRGYAGLKVHVTQPHELPIDDIDRR